MSAILIAIMIVAGGQVQKPLLSFPTMEACRETISAADGILGRSLFPGHPANEAGLQCTWQRTTELGKEKDA